MRKKILSFIFFIFFFSFFFITPAKAFAFDYVTASINRMSVENLPSPGDKLIVTVTIFNDSNQPGSLYKDQGGITYDVDTIITITPSKYVESNAIHKIVTVSPGIPQTLTYTFDVKSSECQTGSVNFVANGAYFYYPSGHPEDGNSLVGGTTEVTLSDGIGATLNAHVLKSDGSNAGGAAIDINGTYSRSVYADSTGWYIFRRLNCTINNYVQANLNGATSNTTIFIAPGNLCNGQTREGILTLNVPPCDTGTCGICSIKSGMENTCSSNNGTQSCANTTLYNGSTNCTPNTYNQGCDLNACSSGYTCNTSNVCSPDATTTPTATPTPTATTTPTPTPAPADTANLAYSCSGSTPTLTASWNVGSASNCNIYIRAGDGDHNIPTSTSNSASCNSTWSGSSLPGGSAIVNGGTYQLYASDNQTTTYGGEVRVNCATSTWGGYCSTSGDLAYYNISGDSTLNTHARRTDNNNLIWQGQKPPKSIAVPAGIAFEWFSEELNSSNTRRGGDTCTVSSSGSPPSADCYVCDQGRWRGSASGCDSGSPQCKNGDQGTFTGCRNASGEYCTLRLDGTVVSDIDGAGTTLRAYTGNFSINASSFPGWQADNVPAFNGPTNGTFSLQGFLNLPRCIPYGDGIWTWTECDPSLYDGRDGVTRYQTTNFYGYDVYLNNLGNGYKMLDQNPWQVSPGFDNFSHIFKVSPPRIISGRISPASASASLTLNTQHPTLTVDKKEAKPGETVTVSWNYLLNPTRLDRIGLYLADTPKDFKYTNNCTQTPADTTSSSGSCTFTMPANEFGVYEFRLFTVVGSGYQPLVTSDKIDLKPRTITLRAFNGVPENTSFNPGDQATLSWGNIPAPSASDSIAIFYLGSSTYYASDAVSANNLPSGNRYYTIPANFPQGVAEFRYYSATQGAYIGTSNTININPKPTILTASSTSINPGDTVTVALADRQSGQISYWPRSWCASKQDVSPWGCTNGGIGFSDGNGFSGYLGDYIGLYPVRSGWNGAAIDYFFTDSCSKPATYTYESAYQNPLQYPSTAASGTWAPSNKTCTLTIPSGTSAGAYEFRLFSRWGSYRFLNDDRDLSVPVYTDYIGSVSNPIIVGGSSGSTTYVPPNLATNKTVSQSSTYTDNSYYGAAKAIDNDSSSTSITKSEPLSWWEVDLGGMKQINSIKIYPRAGVTSQTEKMEVSILDNNRNMVFNSYVPDTSATYNPVTVPNVVGRYVKIQLRYPNPDSNYYLSLGEVQVDGTDYTDPVPAQSTNWAYNRVTVSQSSTYTDNSYYGAEKAVNGVSAGTNIGDLAITQSLANSWWQVDLGSMKPISKIVITPRMDGLSQTENIKVAVLDSSFQEMYTTDLGTVATGNFTAGPNIINLPANTVGRYVKIQHRDSSDYLSLGEVQVWDSQPAVPQVTVTPTPTGQTNFLQAGDYYSGGTVFSAGDPNKPVTLNWQNMYLPRSDDYMNFWYLGQNAASFYSSGTACTNNNSASSGSCNYYIPPAFPVGTGVFRYLTYESPSWVYRSTSNPVTIKPQQVVLTATATTYPGQPITITWSGRPPATIHYPGYSGYAGDYFYIYPNQKFSNSIGYLYTATPLPGDYTPTPVSGTRTFDLPANAKPGVYQVMMFALWVNPDTSGNPVYTSYSLASSNPIIVDTVVGAPYVLSTDIPLITSCGNIQGAALGATYCTQNKVPIGLYTLTFPIPAGYYVANNPLCSLTSIINSSVYDSTCNTANTPTVITGSTVTKTINVRADTTVDFGLSTNQGAWIKTTGGDVHANQ